MPFTRTKFTFFSDERDGGKWSDFGGGREKGETPRETAAREAYEESMGLLGRSPYHLRRKLKRFIVSNERRGRGGRGCGRGRIYFLKMKYDPFVPKTYNKITSYLKKCTWSCPEGYLE